MKILRNILILAAVAIISATGTAIYFKYNQARMAPARSTYGSRIDEPIAVPKQEFDLYYYQPETGVLAREVRELESGEALEDRIRTVLKALATAPERPDLVSPIGSDFAIRAVYIEPETQCAWIDIDSGLLPQSEASAQDAWAAIFACVNTVCAISDDISEVGFLDNGSPRKDTLAGWDLTDPFRPEITFVEYASAG